MRERKGGWERGRDTEEGRGEEGEGEKRETSLESCAFPSFYSFGPWRYFTYTSVQSLSRVWLFATPWTAACQASLSTINSWSLLTLMSIESGMPSHPLSVSCRLILWSFSFSISPSNEYSGLISYRMDWFDLLAVQGTLKSLLQHHASKASILQCSAFFIVQLSHPHMITGKMTTGYFCEWSSS